MLKIKGYWLLTYIIGTSFYFFVAKIAFFADTGKKKTKKLEKIQL